MKIKDIMTPNPFTILPEADVMDHLEIFQDNGVHHIPVITADGDVVGMISSKDFENFLNISAILKSNHRPLRVGDIMTKPVFSYYEDVTVEQCAGAMVDNKIHAVVVMNKQDQMIGIVTSTDLLRYLAGRK